MLTNYPFQTKYVLHIGYNLVNNVKCLTVKRNSKTWRIENAFYEIISKWFFFYVKQTKKTDKFGSFCKI